MRKKASKKVKAEEVVKEEPEKEFTPRIESFTPPKFENGVEIVKYYINELQFKVLPRNQIK